MLIKFDGFCLGGPFGSRFVDSGNSSLHVGQRLYLMAQLRRHFLQRLVGQVETTSAHKYHIKQVQH